jgi:hypothetical protein
MLFLLSSVRAYCLALSKLKRQMPSGNHLRKLRDKRAKVAATSKKVRENFLKWNNSSRFHFTEKHFQQMRRTNQMFSKAAKINPLCHIFLN